MRIPLVIFAFAAITVALVHLRREEAVVRHEIQQVQSTRVELRRKLWDRQTRASYVKAPANVRRHAPAVLGADGPAVQVRRDEPSRPYLPPHPRPQGRTQ